MKCPACKSKTKVVDSRSVPGMNHRRRRHICLKCHNRFTTREVTDDEMAIYESLMVENEQMKATLSYLASFNTRKRGE